MERKGIKQAFIEYLLCARSPRADMYYSISLNPWEIVRRYDCPPSSSEGSTRESWWKEVTQLQSDACLPFSAARAWVLQARCLSQGQAQPPSSYVTFRGTRASPSPHKPCRLPAPTSLCLIYLQSPGNLRCTGQLSFVLLFFPGWLYKGNKGPPHRRRRALWGPLQNENAGLLVQEAEEQCH